MVHDFQAKYSTTGMWGTSQSACFMLSVQQMLQHLSSVTLQVQIQLYLSAVPSLPGALDCLSSGITSTLHPSNNKAAAAVIDTTSSSSSSWSSSDPRCMLLCDPQTAGGLLAGVDAAEAEACVAELRTAGYSQAVVVGRVVSSVTADADGAVDGEQPKGLVQVLEGPQMQSQLKVTALI